MGLFKKKEDSGKTNTNNTSSQGASNTNINVNNANAMRELKSSYTPKTTTNTKSINVNNANQMRELKSSYTPKTNTNTSKGINVNNANNMRSLKGTDYQKQNKVTYSDNTNKLHENYLNKANDLYASSQDSRYEALTSDPLYKDYMSDDDKNYINQKNLELQTKSLDTSIAKADYGMAKELEDTSLGGKIKDEDVFEKSSDGNIYLKDFGNDKKALQETLNVLKNKKATDPNNEENNRKFEETNNKIKEIENKEKYQDARYRSLEYEYAKTFGTPDEIRRIARLQGSYGNTTLEDIGLGLTSSKIRKVGGTISAYEALQNDIDYSQIEEYQDAIDLKNQMYELAEDPKYNLLMEQGYENLSAEDKAYVDSINKQIKDLNIQAKELTRQADEVYSTMDKRMLGAQLTEIANEMAFMQNNGESQTKKLFVNSLVNVVDNLSLQGGGALVAGQAGMRAGTAYMSMSAFGTTYANDMAMGYSPRESLGHASLMYAQEYMTELIGGERIIELFEKSNVLPSTFTEYIWESALESLKSGKAEVIEETAGWTLTPIIDTIYNKMVKGDVGSIEGWNPEELKESISVAFIAGMAQGSLAQAKGVFDNYTTIKTQEGKNKLADVLQELQKLEGTASNKPIVLEDGSVTSELEKLQMFESSITDSINGYYDSSVLGDAVQFEQPNMVEGYVEELTPKADEVMKVQKDQYMNNLEVEAGKLEQQLNAVDDAQQRLSKNPFYVTEEEKAIPRIDDKWNDEYYTLSNLKKMPETEVKYYEPYNYTNLTNLKADIRNKAIELNGAPIAINDITKEQIDLSTSGINNSKSFDGTEDDLIGLVNIASLFKDAKLLNRSEYVGDEKPNRLGNKYAFYFNEFNDGNKKYLAKITIADEQNNNTDFKPKLHKIHSIEIAQIDDNNNTKKVESPLESYYSSKEPTSTISIEQLIRDVNKTKWRNDIPLEIFEAINDGEERIQVGQDTNYRKLYSIENEQNSVDNMIYNSMSMKDADNMVRQAYEAYLKDWYDGVSFEQFVEEVGPEKASEEIAMQIENEPTPNLYYRYVTSNEGIMNEDYTLQDVIDAYFNNNLKNDSGRKQLEDFSYREGGTVEDTFFSQKNIEDGKAVWNTANQRITNANRNEVMQARADAVIFAHNSQASNILGISQSEINRKVKQWSNYSSRAREISNNLNKDVPREYQWVGLENSNILTRANITKQQIQEMVKDVYGYADEYNPKEIANAMLAFDGSINYKNLTIEYLTYEGARAMREERNAMGTYDSHETKIEIGSGGVGTTYHELSHFIDNLWGREITNHIKGYQKNTYLTDYVYEDYLANLRDDPYSFPDDVKTFLNNFKSFMDNLTAKSDIRSSYTQSAKETFARFGDYFVHWVDKTAGGWDARYFSPYNDNFDSRDCYEFVKLLQQKNALNATTFSSDEKGALWTEMSMERFLNQNEESAKTNLDNFLKTNEEIIEGLGLLDGYTGVNTQAGNLDTNLNYANQTREEVLNENIENMLDSVDDELVNFLDNYEITQDELGDYRNELIGWLTDPYEMEGSAMEGVPYETRDMFGELLADYLIEKHSSNIYQAPTYQNKVFDLGGSDLTNNEQNNNVKEEGTNDFELLKNESERIADSEGWGERSKYNDENLRRRLSEVFRVELESRDYSPSNADGLLKDTGDFKIYKDVDGQTFHDIFSIARTYLDKGELVDLHPVETNEDWTGYNDTRNFLSDDGLSGFAITKDGDLISVFNLNREKKGFLRSIAPFVRENVRTLDAYVLPESVSKTNLQDIYNKAFGFETDNVVDYNWDYDHDGIGERYNEPKIAYMVNPNYQSDTQSQQGDTQESVSERQQRFPENLNKSVVLDDKQKTRLAEKVANNEFTYTGLSNQAEVDKARSNLASVGTEQYFTDYMKNNSPSAKTVIQGEVLLAELAKTNDPRWEEVASKLADDATIAGQFLQAYAIMQRLTPEGQLMSIQRNRNRLQQKMDNRFGNKAPQLNLNEELVQNLKDAKTIEEAMEIREKIYKDLEDQVPKTVRDVINSWRYLAMLGNPRTHIRNIVGNGVFAPTVDIKNAIGTALEKAFANKLEYRTKAILNPFSQADKALIDAGKQAYETYRGAMEQGQKYESKSFSEKTKLGRILNKLSDFNSVALDKEDFFFSKARYANSYAQFLKANNLTPETITDEMAKRANQYALLESQKATYRDANSVAEWLNELEYSDKEGLKMASYVKDAIMPFTKTPMNIVKRGLRYSPLGVLYTVAYDSKQLADGKIDANQYIDNMASGLTGTGIALLGALLTSMGLFRTKDDDKDRKKYYDKEKGEQDYAIDLSPFGVDGTYTIDWASPVIMPFAIGAELYNVFKDFEGIEGFSGAINAVADVSAKIMDPIMETSMLSSLQDALNSHSTTGGKWLGDMIWSGVSSYIQQMFPTVGGQIARTIDDTRRTTSPNGGKIDKLIRQIYNKIPWMSKLNQPYINRQGQEEKTEDWGMGWVGRAFLNMVSPGYYSSKDIDEYDEEMYRLYENTGSYDAFPSSTTNQVEFEGEKYKLTPEQYTEWHQTRWQTETEYVNQFIDSKAYENLTDEERVETISDIRSYAQKVAKKQFLESQGYIYTDDKELAESDSKYVYDKQLSGAQGAVDNDIELYAYFDYLNNSGSKQADKVRYLEESGLSQKQKEYLWSLNDYKKSYEDVYAKVFGGTDTKSSSKKKSSKSSKKTSSGKSSKKTKLTTSSAKTGGSSSKAGAVRNSPYKMVKPTETKIANSFLNAYSTSFNRGKGKASTGSSSTVVCPKCGNKVSSASGRCPICGTRL